MTLVLSLLTDDFIIHASDRRLTDGRTGRQAPTRAAKTVICRPAMYMVSYTGLAQIAPPMATGEWLMRTLWAHKNDDLFGSLARAAGNAMDAIPIPRAYKRHAFLVSGWLDHGSWATDRPLPQDYKPGAYATIVSNIHDASVPRGLLSEPGLEFTHSTRLLFRNQKFLIESVGSPLNQNERENLDRDISAALRSLGGRERAAALLMARTIHTVAERDPAVGGGVFIAAIPRHLRRDAADNQRPRMEFFGGIRWGLPEEGAATFVHIPDDRASTTVETPYILDDPFSGIGSLTIKEGPVPDLGPLSGTWEAGEMEFRIIPWYSSNELKRRSGVSPDSPTDASDKIEKS
jgi:hypothetical protein